MAVPYSTIPDSDIDPESVIDTPLMTSYRDNPIAIAEGAPGAPRVQRGAIQPGVGHRWFFDYGNEADGAITHSANTDIAPGLWQCTTFQIDPTYTVGLINKGPLIICATTSIIINGTLDCDGDGAAGGSSGASRIGNSGMFGGTGGGSTVVAGGNTFLTGSTFTNGVSQSSRTKQTLLSLMPIFNVVNGAISASFLLRDDAEVGGGGGASGATGNSGGHGGGLIVLVAPMVIVGPAGVVTADGNNVTATGGIGAGGGGAIVIATPPAGYTNNGSVAALQGIGASGSYDGGAGWVESITL